MGAELPTTKPTIAGMHWCDGGSHETRTEPGEPLKDAGYATANPGTIPTAANWNWLMYIIGEILAWFDRAIIRRFSSPVDAITNVEADGLACIQTPYNATARGLWSGIQQIAIGHTISAMCVDGLYVYVSYEDTDVVYVEAWRADLATRAWQHVSDSESNFSGYLCCDGAYVYYGYQNPSTHAYGMQVLNATDGTVKQTIALYNDSVTSYPRHVATNGHTVLVGSTKADHEIEIWQWVAGTLTYVDDIDVETADSITALYCGPDTGCAGFDVDASSTLAVTFDFAGTVIASLDTSVFSTEPGIITDITSDGHGFLLACDPCNITASHSATNMIRWNEPFFDGGIWNWVSGEGETLEQGTIVTDGRIVVVVGATKTIWYDIHTLKPLGYSTVVHGADVASDGYRLYVATTSNVYQYYMGYDARLYRVANTSDVNRVPLQGQRLIPVE